ncbi:MAG: hypothetical protein B6D40_08225, partial [Anaerolineae bacterium UTCFX3]
MPADTSFLKDACQITGADWAALADRDDGDWRLRASHGLSRPARDLLQERLARPVADAWLCGAVNAGRPRTRAAGEVPALEDS